ncbi:MAG: class I SAM-dependent methyltransferase [Rhodobacteraceae bacterium]|nr:class I SAM-dependent methyltransferase [Paracoccaceae bacterium]
MSEDAETIAVYNARAADYDALVHQNQPNEHLQAFIRAVPRGGLVLDLGCGPGSSSAKLRDAGLHVTAIDASRQMAATAKRKFDIDVVVATFEDISGTDLYDGIWASFSLLHAPKTDLPRHLAALHQAIRPGGIFVIGLKTGTGEHRDTLGRKYSYYEKAELHALLGDAGFAVVETSAGEDIGLDGVIAPWLIVTARA